MQNSKNRYFLIGILIAILIVGLIMRFGNGTQPTQSLPTEDQISNEKPINIFEAQKEYVGEISTSTDGMISYRNNKLGLTFTFPQGWIIGDNHIMYGTFQLFNYDPATAPAKDTFPADTVMNKIEMVTGKASYFSDEASSDYPQKSRATSTIEVDGLQIRRSDTELVGGQKYRTYVIPVPDTDLILYMTMYGNPDNFYILDDILKSMSWDVLLLKKVQWFGSKQDIIFSSGIDSIVFSEPLYQARNQGSRVYLNEKEIGTIEGAGILKGKFSDDGKLFNFSVVLICGANCTHYTDYEIDTTSSSLKIGKYNYE